MRSPTPWIAALALVLMTAPAAEALCAYRGELYGQTTLRQEFTDAEWVVRARVVSGIDSWTGGEPDDDETEPWTTYRIEVLETFKGPVQAGFTLFTERNSGGFYLDRVGGGHDIGGEYLLFLNPTPSWLAANPAARDAVSVNYSCGQSKRWDEVSASDRDLLQSLKV